jgi:hypothetical protein
MTDIASKLNDTLKAIKNAKAELTNSCYSPPSTRACIAANLSFDDIAILAVQDSKFLDMFIKQNYDSNQIDVIGYNICGVENNYYETLTDNEKLNIKTMELRVLNDIINIFSFTPILSLIIGDNALPFLQAVELRAHEINKVTLKSIAIYNLFDKLKKKQSHDRV